MEDNFPCQIQYHNELRAELDSPPQDQEKDIWSYIWGNQLFSVPKAYMALTGYTSIIPVFNWLWGSKCQPKHKVFFTTFER
jgi:hypothetical protein